jgi:hypothetical protein
MLAGIPEITFLYEPSSDKMGEMKEESYLVFNGHAFNFAAQDQNSKIYPT